MNGRYCYQPHTEMVPGHKHIIESANTLSEKALCNRLQLVSKKMGYSICHNHDG
ncbi:hypothetical protein M5M_16812 [Simiduia agarivorans SA1 = DSM 21679]|uniref:Uncharacterized protein n=1 Tax=Simiduia agarivorans (strain DSM 21679 / JCM 13881 / BCRC 17597 / SA1) TaxID=1117647 RepID=R9S5W3_SIMAS|nr:hypothetical protein M5M_16812 [Simiduia agarivorans SA1 = DSM 21679]